MSWNLETRYKKQSLLALTQHFVPVDNSKTIPCFQILNTVFPDSKISKIPCFQILNTVFPDSKTEKSPYPVRVSAFGNYLKLTL